MSTVSGILVLGDVQAMNKNWKRAAMLAVMLVPSLSLAQQTCGSGIQIDGTITDPAGAVIPGATVQAASGERTTADATGHYVLPCAHAGSTTLMVEADGFAPGTARAAAQLGGVAHINLQLAIAAVQTDVQVGEDVTAMDADHGVGTRTLTTQDVQLLADDPDDFLRELQALASRGGGIPGAATITVDGFQNGSALPPKGLIASIRVNPDMFSPEYERAPYLGGRVEIFTKPGAGSFHGALFLTDSDGSFNATDPFSLTATPAGKRRYGFELSGPVVPNRGDVSLALEKRDIDEFNVVNAVTLDANNNQVPLQQAVSAPQRLWIASVRSGWQLTPKDTATLSFSADVNNLGNQGIGGLTLAEAGYSSLVREYDLRFANTQTLSANLLHETRIGYTWKRTDQTPLSTAPALQVAGYFNGGGATSQNLNDRERDLEVDDDVMITHGKHSLKFGAQSLGIFVHDYDPNTFNGAYIFGGGSAPTLDANNNPTGQTTTISAMEQYRRALLNFPGGTPTTYQLTTGTPLVPLAQWRLALYAEDAIKLTPGFTVATGLRYQLQTSPGSFANFAPRVGFSWAPGKKQSWVFHLRAGLFHDPNIRSYATEVYRLNGARQQQATVYSPSFSDPLTPITGSIKVSTVNQFPKSLDQVSSLQSHISVEHNFNHDWHALATLFWAENWGSLRIANINAPLVSSSNGTPPDPTAALLAPRPIALNENIMQYQNSGHLAGKIFVTGVDRNSSKLGFSAYYVHTNLKTDTGTGVISPQSSYSEQGESSRPDGQTANAIYASGHLTLPYKVELSSILDAESGQPYNITTGTDVNGDGNFNDRPSYASASGVGVYSTRFGFLTTNTVNGDVPRNLGTMPPRIHLDTNLSRVFKLNPNDKDHPRTLTFNARSANLLNHTNVTAVGTVVSSSTFSQPLSAETARRAEIGVRFAF
jgi:Carboxypeptidase regulatory-like domain